MLSIGKCVSQYGIQRRAYEEWRFSKLVIINQGRKYNRITAFGNTQTPPLLICRVCALNGKYNKSSLNERFRTNPEGASPSCAESCPKH
jgi:hypothetical protein